MSPLEPEKPISGTPDEPKHNTGASPELASHRAVIIASARGWLGTPFRHQASLRGAGCDCLGLVRGIWREVCGAEPEACPPYTADWADLAEPDALIAAMRRHCREIAPGHARPGDILLFRMSLGAPARHAAILVEPSCIIHAYWGRAVVESRLVPWWTRRIAAAFEFPVPH